MNDNLFIESLKEIGIIINKEQEKQFHQYYLLLVEWNQKMNLTGITEKDQVYLKHFYDSATLVKIIDFNKYNNFCDIGSGAGFPGIVIKILYPHLKVTLVDSLNKRIIFLEEVISQLNLSNIDAIHIRSEDFAKKNREKFEIVTARAVAPLNILLELCIPLVKEQYYFIPMKADISREINNDSKVLDILDSKLEETIEFLLPIENSQRTILKYKKIKKTNLKYPRLIKEIKNNPL